MYQAIVFKAAIDIAHPNAKQVNDRFHIIKNLVKLIKKSLQKLIIGRIEISLTSEAARERYQYLIGLTRREKIIEAKKLREKGVSIKKISKDLHISITTTSKYIKLEESQIPKEHISKRGQEHIDATNKVKYKVDRVLLLHNQGLQIREISKITGYSELSIKKYISEKHNVVHGHYGISRPGILEQYRDEVLTLRCKGIAYKEIAKIISEKGYKGSIAALRGFISKERRIAKDLLKEREPVELIDKKSIIKLLYKSIDEVKELTKKQYEAVIKAHPIIFTFIDILTEFKSILEKKDSNFLESWIEKVNKLKIKEMDSFINGLQNDYNATLNGIELSYNNGLAEGSINKIKSIKRIMYGRNNFMLLRHKVLQLEALKSNY